MRNLITDYLGVHAQAMPLREQRMKLIASNLGNADTPGYKAQDLDFDAALRHAQGQDANGLMATTHEQHYEISSGLNPFQIAREGVKIGDPPVGIELRAPWRDELIIEARKIGAAVREGDDQRGVAAVDAQPVHQPIPGSSAATAAARLPVRISAVAASISGWKCRSSPSVGMIARRCPRAASSAALDVSGAWKSMP